MGQRSVGSSRYSTFQIQLYAFLSDCLCLSTQPTMMKRNFEERQLGGANNLPVNFARMLRRRLLPTDASRFLNSAAAERRRHLRLLRLAPARQHGNLRALPWHQRSWSGLVWGAQRWV